VSFPSENVQSHLDGRAISDTAAWDEAFPFSPSFERCEGLRIATLRLRSASTVEELQALVLPLFVRETAFSWGFADTGLATADVTALVWADAAPLGLDGTPEETIRAISPSDTKRRRPTVTVCIRPAAARRRTVYTETPHASAACRTLFSDIEYDSF
jgi:hypothetical protein